MSISREKRWIVLINKSPRGPLTQEEIQNLLAENIIRRNDLAFEVTANSEEVTSGWKLIWQFPEFERRTKDASPDSQTPQERRKPVTERKAELEKEKALPEDLAEISPEDLLLKKKIPSNFSPTVEEIRDPISLPSDDLDRVERGLFKKAIGALTALIFVFAYFQLKPKSPEPPFNRKPASTGKEKIIIEAPQANTRTPLSGRFPTKPYHPRIRNNQDNDVDSNPPDPQDERLPKDEGEIRHPDEVYDEDEHLDYEDDNLDGPKQKRNRRQATSAKKRKKPPTPVEEYDEFEPPAEAPPEEEPNYEEPPPEAPQNYNDGENLPEENFPETE